MSEQKSSFNDLINNSETPVLVDFFAEWCGPCKAMAPMLSQFASDMDGKVKVLKVDVDKNPAASNKYQIQAVPTMILFHKGEILWRHSGMVPMNQLKQVVESVPV